MKNRYLFCTYVHTSKWCDRRWWGGSLHHLLSHCIPNHWRRQQPTVEMFGFNNTYFLASELHWIETIRIHNSTLYCISTVEIEKNIYLLYLGGLLYIVAQAINIEYDYSDPQTSSKWVVQTETPTTLLWELFTWHTGHIRLCDQFLSPTPRPHTFFGGSTGRAGGCKQKHFRLFMSSAQVHGIATYHE